MHADPDHTPPSASPVPGAPSVSLEAMAEALCKVDSKPHHITWAQMAERAAQGDMMCSHIMDSYRGRASPLSAALAVILARLQPDARPEAAGSELGEAVREAAEAKAEEEERRRLMHDAEDPLVKLFHQKRMFEAIERREAAETRRTAPAPPSRGADQGGDRDA